MTHKELTELRDMLLADNARLKAKRARRPAKRTTGFLTSLARTFNPSGLPLNPTEARTKRLLTPEGLLKSKEWRGSVVKLEEIAGLIYNVLLHPSGAVCRLLVPSAMPA